MKKFIKGVFKKTIISYIVVDSMPLLWGILINKNIFGTRNYDMYYVDNEEDIYNILKL